MAADLALTLPPDASAPSVARTATKRYLAGDVDPQRLSELTLVISELVSNASVHGRGQIVLRLQLDDAVVRGEVIDQGAGFEREVRARGPEEVSGAADCSWSTYSPVAGASMKARPTSGSRSRPGALRASGRARGSARTSALKRSTERAVGDHVASTGLAQESRV